MSTLVSTLTARATEEPQRPALTFLERGGEQTITRGEFLQSAQAYSRRLAAAGLSAGDLVILVLQHSLDLVYAFWGAALIGAVPSIFPFLTEKLDPGLYRQRVKTLVEHSGAKVVITYPENFEPLSELLNELPIQILVTGIPAPDSELLTSELSLRSESLSPDAIALLQHSSGSTGLQKGVALSHRAVLRQVEAYGKAIQLDPASDVIVSWLPLYHDMGLIAGFVLPILTGTHLVLMSPFEWVRQPTSLLDAIGRHRGTLCWLPNFAYKLIARSVRPGAEFDLASWRGVINCSEPVYDESHQAFVEKLAPFGLSPDALAVSYAMAENTFAVTQTALGQPPRVDVVEIAALQERGEAIPDAAGKRVVSCGAPIESVELAIFDAERNRLPERKIGEIGLRSEFMLSGYYKRPDLSAEALTADGWYLTGDMGYLAGGELYISGRKKDLLIVGGKNIYPQDLEEIANRTAGVYPGRAVAFGVLDERLGSEKVVIICETTEDADLAAAEQELRAKVVQETEVTVGDLRFVLRGWILKTSSGKHARTDNREKYLREFGG
ncbi:MAG: AMP-binding protein [Anaerolineales bacterium]|nr:MAG: AMP-binding protein [Anaerolineales bacterium]